MINVDAEIYREFKCKADKCNHSCCKGWEIDIDDDTLIFYDSLDTKLGKEIRKNIDRENDNSFILTNDKKCPFLKDDGLCRIIQEMGEDGLCDICRLHPRFFLDIDNYSLAGVGLSCERSCELLAKKEKLLFVIDDEEKVDLAKLLELLNIDEPNLKLNNMDDVNLEKMLNIFYKTEPIDDNWKREVLYIKENCKSLEKIDLSKYNVIYQYIIFRQLNKFRKLGINRIIKYAKYSIAYIILSDILNGDFIEAVRRWSEQIEYNEDNVAFVIDSL